MASKEIMLRSLQKAIQGEMDSVTIYKSAADHTSDSEVKEFFLSRMKEEQLHYNYLVQYYKMISNDVVVHDIMDHLVFDNLLDSIFSSAFIQRIGEDQVLFSAISTALLLEKDAVDHYSKCEKETDILTLKSFYSIMVKWEKKHYEDLLEIQKEAEQYYWQINNFEPF